MNAIVACGLNGEIGKDNQLLIKIKKDLKFFKEITTGKIVVMGRKTFESLPDKKPLPNRINIVLSRNKIEDENVITIHSLNDLFDELEKYNTEDVFIIGGAEIYKTLLPFCEYIYQTEVLKTFYHANKFFNLDRKNFTLIEKSDIMQEVVGGFGVNFIFKKYKNYSKCMKCNNPKLIATCNKCNKVNNYGLMKLPDVNVKEIWTNLKNGNFYEIVSIENNQTNCRNDEVMVMYQSIKDKRIYPRNIFEFVKKFKKEVIN